MGSRKKRTPVLEPLFNKTPCENCEISKNTYFKVHLLTTAPENFANFTIP